MSFRQLVKRGLWIRVIDFVGHLLLGFLLNSILFQFVPDVLLPIIWIKSWKTDKLLPEQDSLIQIHKLLHTIYMPVGLLMVCPFLGENKQTVFWLSVQWITHVVWDQVTHPEKEFAKSLWRINA